MSSLAPQCQQLQAQVESILQLIHQEAALRSQDITSVQISLDKAISPKFEIVFAGAFSALMFVWIEGEKIFFRFMGRKNV